MPLPLGPASGQSKSRRMQFVAIVSRISRPGSPSDVCGQARPGIFDVFDRHSGDGGQSPIARLPFERLLIFIRLSLKANGLWSGSRPINARRLICGRDNGAYEQCRDVGCRTACQIVCQADDVLGGMGVLGLKRSA